MVKKIDTGDKLDFISDRINRRDLLDINNDYNASSSDTDETEGSAFEKDPTDLSDITPPISAISGTSGSLNDGYFNKESNAVKSTGRKEIGRAHV